MIPDIKFKCHWDKSRMCDKGLHCGGCEHQPPDEEKVNGKKPPVKLPIINDGYGFIPECPACGEMPYSTERCTFCGQRFIKDEIVEEWEKPLPEETLTCIFCGGEMVGTRSKYNGHFHGKCKSCGAVMME